MDTEVRNLCLQTAQYLLFSLKNQTIFQQVKLEKYKILGTTYTWDGMDLAWTNNVVMGTQVEVSCPYLCLQAVQCLLFSLKNQSMF